MRGMKKIHEESRICGRTKTRLEKREKGGGLSFTRAGEKGRERALWSPGKGNFMRWSHRSARKERKDDVSIPERKRRGKLSKRAGGEAPVYPSSEGQYDGNSKGGQKRRRGRFGKTKGRGGENTPILCVEWRSGIQVFVGASGKERRGRTRGEGRLPWVIDEKNKKKLHWPPEEKRRKRIFATVSQGGGEKRE